FCEPYAALDWSNKYIISVVSTIGYRTQSRGSCPSSRWVCESKAMNSNSERASKRPHGPRRLCAISLVGLLA
ncbi:hypothetical protein BD779DRAFT_1493460, partial [Infundibulicybe gibba]